MSETGVKYIIGDERGWKAERYREGYCAKCIVLGRGTELGRGEIRETIQNMCGRFTLHVSPEQIAAQFDVAEPERLADRFNIAPTQPVGIVRLDKGGAAREWALVHWGLIPSWSKDPGIGARMINARGETVAEKPSFRAAMKRRRCLVAADGFYEWKRIGKRKQPYYIRLRSHAPFAFAGLWEIWAGPDGSELESCTVITTTPNELMVDLHDRMPVILAPEDYAQWLGSGQDADRREVEMLQHLIRPYDADDMEAYPVSTAVNNPMHEGAGLISPLSSLES